MRLPQRPPTADGHSILLDRVPSSGLPGPEIGGEYLHWDDLRRRTPPPELDHATWWALVSLARRGGARPFPLRDGRGQPFRYTMTDTVQRLVHTIDRDASGRIELPEDVATPGRRDRYIVSSLIEEAITSSQIEGAATTRRVARDMLETGRAPRDRSERMIWNNFRAIEWVRAHVGAPLTPALLLELHRVVTLDTLDGGDDGAGRFRRPGELVHVIDHADNEVLHVPPDAATLPERVAAMCAFGNEDDRGEGPFVHPVVRAILLHFWLAYDHPFVDGNGRTARALFYWSMLRQGYWLTELVSISSVINRARQPYLRAFLLTEDGDNDATYFLVHQLRVVRRAIDDLSRFLERTSRELRDIEHRLRGRTDLNPRQLAILARALRHPADRWTIEQHKRTSGVTYQTARTDLLDLAAKGFLEQAKRGKAFVFTAAPDLERRLGRR